ncbi:MAG: aminotransferase class I/II-fold pyridoxal phosphate-dependent enzyme [Calditrichaeota bacterium]|nr:aminotransferase class I/II-fold pyridoxal phosphate-dependent enzyme [Calditrichota bacterium]
MLAKRLKYLKPSGIRKIFDLAQSIENPVNLSIGMTDFNVPEPIRAEAKLWMDRGLNQYVNTQGLPELREQLSQNLQEEGVQFDDVIITSGVTGGYVISIMALVNPGDEVLIPDPRFVMYSFVVELFGGIPRFIDTYPDFKLRPEQIEAMISPKTRVLVLNNPNNPTGVVLSPDEVKAIAEVAKKHNLYVISDEIYNKFLYDDIPYTSIANFYEKAVVLRGYAKSWGMSGWRIGYVAAANELMTYFKMLQHYTYVCAPPFLQKAAMVAENFDGSEIIRDYQEKRDFIYHGLSGFLDVQKPQGAFYIFPKVPQGTATELVEQAVKRKLLMVPGQAFSEKDTHFRISFAASREALEKGIEILYDLVNGH